MNKLLKTLLKTGVYFLEQAEGATVAVRDRAIDRVDDLADRATEMMGGRAAAFTARDAISLAAGIGVGLGVAILFAPASGRETRDAVVGKVQDLRDNVRDRFSRESKSA